MNGFQLLDQNQAGFLDKFLRREPRENAFIEINNILACVPILRIDHASIEACLGKHKISFEQARSRLLNFYTILLQHFLSNDNISPDENEKLIHLQRVFQLTEIEVSTVHKTYTRPVYIRTIIEFVSDGILTDAEKERLSVLATSLRVSKAAAKELYVNEASKYLHSVLKMSLEDGMLSNGEESELKKIAENLQVDLKFSQNARENLARCRYLWQLHTGKLPEISVSIYLDKDEFCSARISARRYKVSNRYGLVKYSGYNELQDQHRIEFHSGRVPTTRITGKSLQILDEGTLYFTNKRLLFNGTNGTVSFPYLSLIGGSFYRNGMLIEREERKDQFFEFKGDSEALRLIFDTLMTRCRE